MELEGTVGKREIDEIENEERASNFFFLIIYMERE